MEWKHLNATEIKLKWNQQQISELFNENASWALDPGKLVESDFEYENQTNSSPIDVFTQKKLIEEHYKFYDKAERVDFR